MNYPQCLTDLQNDVLSRLAAASNAHIAELATGSGGAPTISTALTLTQYLNEEAADLARYYYPVFDNGTISSFTAARFVANSKFVCADGGTIRAIRSVTWNGGPLQYTSRSQLELNVGPVGQDAAAAPQYWYPEGDGIGIYPLPNATQALAVYGLSIPAQMLNSSLNGSTISGATNTNPIVVTTANPHNLTTGRTVVIQGVTGNTAANGTWIATILSANTFSIPVAGNSAYISGGTVDDVPTWLEADLEKALVFGAVLRVAEKNIQNIELAARVPVWTKERDDIRMQLLMKAYREDPGLAGAHLLPMPQANA